MKAIRVVLATLVLVLSGCASQGRIPAGTQAPPAHTAAPEETAAAGAMPEEDKRELEEGNIEMEDTMRLRIGETEVPVTWEDNASVEALRALCPLTIQMSMYGGFEQVGPIGQRIAREDEQTDTSCGDIVLYSGDQLVIFYGANSWAYTRLGHITLTQREMTGLLGNGDVSITLE